MDAVTGIGRGKVEAEVVADLDHGAEVQQRARAEVGVLMSGWIRILIRDSLVRDSIAIELELSSEC